jgi:hypothetical protein
VRPDDAAIFPFNFICIARGLDQFILSRESILDRALEELNGPAPHRWCAQRA